MINVAAQKVMNRFVPISRELEQIRLESQQI